MCRLGANVTGIDASKKNIEIAKIHAKKNNLNINYICTSPEKIEKKNFDVILNMEIVEHVENTPFPRGSGAHSGIISGSGSLNSSQL